jgi:protein-S-isoprenylcysteine O-methyltransferase Ste14
MLVLGVGLVVYCTIHSLLASMWMKNMIAKRCPGLMPAYRLMFAAQAVILLIPLVWLLYRSPGPLLWSWRGPWFWVANLLALLAAIGFLWAGRSYDLQEFVGVRQWRTRARFTDDQEQFRISFLHRFVRHPWYFFILVILWTRDVHAADLVMYTVITLYLVIGSQLEERALLACHGDLYRRYRERVPGLIPLPWRYLNRTEAAELVKLGHRQKRGARDEAPGILCP